MALVASIKTHHHPGNRKNHLRYFQLGQRMQIRQHQLVEPPVAVQVLHYHRMQAILQDL